MATLLKSGLNGENVPIELKSKIARESCEKKEKKKDLHEIFGSYVKIYYTELQLKVLPEYRKFNVI